MLSPQQASAHSSRPIFGLRVQQRSIVLGRCGTFFSQGNGLQRATRCPPPDVGTLPLPRRLRARGLGSGSGATFPHDDYEAWSWWWPEGELPEVSTSRSHTCLA